MIDNKVHNQFHITLLDFFDKVVNISQGAITGVDVLVVCDIISHISYREVSTYVAWIYCFRGLPCGLL